MPNPKIGDSSTFSNLIGQIKTRLNNYQTKNLSSPIVVAGESKDTVESALSAINNNASGGSFYKDFKSNSQLGLTNFYGKNVWHDGNDTYHSNGSYQYKLNRSIATQETQTWLGLTQPNRTYIQSDGEDIYYSRGTNHYILDRETSTWETKVWTGLTNFNGNDIQTDGNNIYYDNNANHYVLDKDTSTWSTKTQNGITYLFGQYIQYDGDNIYYSYQTQNVLNKETSTQSTKTWTNNLGSGVSLYGSYIQTDGVDVYFSSGTISNGVQGKLDRETSTWNLLNRLSEVRPLAEDIWQDNGNIYWSTNGANAVLTEIPIEDLINVPNGLAGLNSNGRIFVNQTNYVTVGQKSGSTLGTGATAEGSNNVASNTYAHAEGYTTTASGVYAHAEGANAVASGGFSHAEGQSTTASHSYSHASGYQTKTGKNAQFVAGTINKGSADTLFEVGNGTHASTDRHNAFEVKDKNGSIKIGDTLISTIATGARGNGSQQTYQPNTTSSVSHQDYTGYWVKFNVGSTTMKEGLVPQTYEGITVDTTVTTADGTNEDQVKVVVYENVLTEGGIIVDGEVIDGTGNKLSDKVDSKVIADDFDSTIPYAEDDYVMHNGSLWKCTDAHAAGAWTTAHFTQTKVTDELGGSGDAMIKGVDYVTAGQVDGETLGEYATAEGYEVVASGEGAHAEGAGTTAYGDISHAEGFGTSAGYDYQHVQGKYNNNKSTSLFEIGNGTADNARSNAFEVDWNGDVIAAGDVMDGSGNTLADVATLSGYVADMSDEIDDIETALDGKANVEKRYSYGDNWSTKTWTGGTGLTSFYGNNVWSDGTDIYYSDAATQYVLDKATSTWYVKTWNLNFDGSSTWTDGTDIYYSYGSKQYVLDKATSTWSVKTWNGLTSFYGYNIWTDGTDIYYSDGYYSAQYILDKATSTWSVKTWTGLTDFNGGSTWTDGTDIYYSSVSNQYVLNKATSTWSVKTWTGLTSFNGNNIWTDGTDIYYSYDGSTQYVLDKATSTWSVKTWTGLTNFSGRFIWTDGTDIYYSSITNQYVLNKIEGAVVIENSITVKLNGDVVAAGSVTVGPGGLILPINPSTTPTANGAIQIETT